MQKDETGLTKRMVGTAQLRHSPEVGSSRKVCLACGGVVWPHSAAVSTPRTTPTKRTVTNANRHKHRHSKKQNCTVRCTVVSGVVALRQKGQTESIKTLG